MISVFEAKIRIEGKISYILNQLILKLSSFELLLPVSGGPSRNEEVERVLLGHLQKLGRPTHHGIHSGLS